jgi:nicotinamide-nucleotide amidase
MGGTLQNDSLTYCKEYEKKIGVYLTSALKLADGVKNLASSKGLSVVTAESCSGGLLAGILSELPGSSLFYGGGVTVYSNEAKSILTGIDPKDIATYGAVSEVVARQLALGIRQKLGGTYGIALTGIAGPTGATANKPVGTVWCGISSREGEESELFQLSGQRYDVRWQSVIGALELLLNKMK